MIKLFSENFKNDWIVFPEVYLKLKEKNEYDFLPWYILNDSQIEFWFKYLYSTYNRNLYPFARKDQTDDFACWEKNKGTQIQIIHTFASSGWEQREKFNNFQEWYEWALQQKIN